MVSEDNICRSAFAHAAMVREVDSKGLTSIEVRSAGVQATVNRVVVRFTVFALASLTLMTLTLRELARVF